MVDGQNINLTKSNRESMDCIKLLLDELEECLLVLDLSCNIIDMNKTFALKIEYTNSELYNMNISLLCPPERRNDVLEKFEQMQEGKLGKCAIPLYSKNGKYIPVEVRAFKGVCKEQDVINCIIKDVSEVVNAKDRYVKSFYDNPSIMTISTLDTDEYIDVNEMFLSTLGYKRYEIIGKTASDLNLFVDPYCRNQILEETLKHGYSRNKELMLKDKKGDVIVGLAATDIFGIGKDKYILTFIDNITQKRNIEKRESQAKARLNAILDNLPFLAWLKDLDGRFIAVNKPFEEACGKVSDNIIGKTDFNVWSKELALKYRSDDMEVIRTRSKIFVEELIHVKNSEKWFETFKTPIFDEYGKLMGTTGMARDITERKLTEKSMKEQKDFAEMLVNTVPSAVFTVDINKIVTTWNNRAAQITGYSAEDIVGKPCSVFNDENCKRKCGLYSKEIPKPVFEQMCTITTKHGEIRHVSKNVDVLRNEFGNIVGGIECFEDITDRLKVEQQLKDSQMRLTIATSGTNVGLWEYDIRTHEFDFSNECATMYGYSSEEINEIRTQDRNTLLNKLLYNDDYEKLVGIIQNNNNRDSLELEIRVKHKNGKWVWVLIRGTIIEWDKNLNPVKMVGTQIDISQIKKVQEELQKKEKIISASAMSVKELLYNRNYYDAIYNCFDILGKATHVDRIYLFKNSYSKEGEGFTSQKIEWNSGVSQPQINNPELKNIPFEEVVGFIEPLIKRQAFNNIVSEIEDGKTKKLLQSQNIKSLIVLPIFIRDVFWGFVGFDECKFERRWTSLEIFTLSAFVNSVEKAIERSLIENELEKARKASEAANVMKSRFIANMSHEIRTPMNGIVGFVELLSLTDTTEEQQEYICEAKAASQMLLYIINDILDLSKIEAGKLMVEKVPFNLKEVVENTVVLHMPKAFEKQIMLVNNIDHDVPDEIVGDPSRLRQVLNNLIGNAIKFTERGTVSVDVSVDKVTSTALYIKFCVKDTGIGIKGEDAQKLFKPFSQLDASTTRKYGGTGLGLVISKELINLMNGEIWFESVPDEGTTFFFSLPFENPDYDVFKYNEAQNSLYNTDEGNSSDTSILLVEDNEINQKIVIKVLQKHNYTCDVAMDGAEALKAYKNKQYDIIFMDCQMPVMDGFECTANIRALENDGEHIPIIAMTANAMEGDRERCLEAGMDDYISKPIDFEIMLNMVKKYLAD